MLIKREIVFVLNLVFTSEYEEKSWRKKFLSLSSTTVDWIKLKIVLYCTHFLYCTVHPFCTVLSNKVDWTWLHCVDLCAVFLLVYPAYMNQKWRATKIGEPFKVPSNGKDFCRTFKYPLILLFNKSFNKFSSSNESYPSMD